MSDLRKSLLAKGSRRITMSRVDFKPILWTNYFQNQFTVETDDENFHIYSTGCTGPILLCLHGGGYSGLTWALFAADIVNKIDCHILAMDLRGHGSTTTANDSDLSLATMAKDVVRAMEHMFRDVLPPVVLIGHSMGGAVAVETAKLLPNVVALCVIDVVEGTALESLSSMQSVLKSRPPTFKTIENAVQWGYKAETHNLEAAKVSMPGQIKNLHSGELAATEILRMGDNRAGPSAANDDASSDISWQQFRNDSIPEESDDLTNAGPSTATASTSTNVSSDLNLYVWRIDLSKTERYWTGWFRGLSQKFLNISVPKILLLANVHGLDTALTVGQMQGKFQFQVLQKSGHAIHEDQPHKVADIIAGFLVKQKIATPLSNFTPSMPAC